MDSGRFPKHTKNYRIMKNQFKIGQEIEFKNGACGIVFQFLTKGNVDIRPPYNREGLPVVKGVNFIGYINIIPDEWDKIYDDERNESEIVKITDADHNKTDKLSIVVNHHINDGNPSFAKFLLQKYSNVVISKTYIDADSEYKEFSAKFPQLTGE